MASEADPKRRDLDDGKYDVTQLANQKARLPVLPKRKKKDKKEEELELHSVFKNAFTINSELVHSQFVENGTIVGKQKKLTAND